MEQRKHFAFIKEKIKKKIFSPNFSFIKSDISFIKQNTDVRQVIIEYIVDNYEEKEWKNIIKNFSIIFLLLSFGMQQNFFYLLIKYFKESAIGLDEEELALRENEFSNRIVIEIKRNIEKIYTIEDPVDLGSYLAFLEQISTSKTMLSKNITNSIDLSSKISDYYELQEDFFDFNEEEKEELKKEEKINFHLINKKKNKNNIERNPTKIGHLIFNGEDINKETLNYLSENDRFLNAVTNSIFSTYSLKDIIKDRESSDDVFLFKFIKDCANYNNELFKKVIKKLHIFISQNSLEKLHFIEHLDKIFQVLDFNVSEKNFIKASLSTRSFSKLSNRPKKIVSKDNYDFENLNNDYIKKVESYFKNDIWDSFFEKIDDKEKEELSKIIVKNIIDNIIENKRINVQNGKKLGNILKYYKLEHLKIFFILLISYKKKKELKFDLFYKEKENFSQDKMEFCRECIKNMEVVKPEYMANIKHEFIRFFNE